MILGPPRTLVLYFEREVGEELPYGSQREEDLHEDECLAVSWELDHLVYGVAWEKMLGRLGVGVERGQQGYCPSPYAVEEEK